MRSLCYVIWRANGLIPKGTHKGELSQRAMRDYSARFVVRITKKELNFVKIVVKSYMLVARNAVGKISLANLFVESAERLPLILDNGNRVWRKKNYLRRIV